VDNAYWQQRVGAATLQWTETPILDDDKLRELVPSRSATFKGPQVLVTEPKPEEVIARMTPSGSTMAPIPAIIARRFGNGRVVYLPACLDAAMWSYSYPYQRRILTKLVEWAAGENNRPPFQIDAPMCVQTTFWIKRAVGVPPRNRIVIHFFNSLNTTANHGLPAVDVPLREETVPIHGIKVDMRKQSFRQILVEPAHQVPKILNITGPVVELPALELHQMLFLE
jgi:hypothetical protein